MDQTQDSGATDGTWAAGVLDLLRAQDPDWAHVVQAMTTGPWRGDVLPPRFVELVAVAINVAVTRVATAHDRNPCAVSRKYTSSPCRLAHLTRRRPAK